MMTQDLKLTLAELEFMVAKACALIDRLKAEKAELLEALQVVSSGRVARECCWCDDIAISSSHEHSAACLTARAAVASAESRS